jgi:hypothetical protein
VKSSLKENFGLTCLHQWNGNTYSQILENYRGTLNRITQLCADSQPGKTLTPEEEDKVVEALEELRINYNLRQWRVCSLICESLADKFRTIASNNDK